MKHLNDFGVRATLKDFPPIHNADFIPALSVSRAVKVISGLILQQLLSS